MTEEYELPDYYQDLFLDSGDAIGFDCPALTPDLVALAELALGYKLPDAYVRLLEVRNGGYLTRPICPTDEPTAWAADHVYVDRICGIGGEDGIEAGMGSRFLIEEWGYPNVGVVFSSNGPTAFMLDYSECDIDGEPRVIYVHVDPGSAPNVILLADDFDGFLERLEPF